MDYWKECVEIAFEEAGVKATKEQIDSVAGAVEGGHENYGMAFGHDAIPNPLRTELDGANRRISSLLEDQETKVHLRNRIERLESIILYRDNTITNLRVEIENLRRGL